MSDASKALLEIYNNVKELLRLVKDTYTLQSENNKILRGMYYQNNKVNTVQPPRFTVKNMTDAQLKDLILQGLSFEFIYYLSNRKFSIDYIRQVAQKIK